MRRGLNRVILTCLFILAPSLGIQSAHASILGEELIPLAKLVAGQVIELERLSETMGIAKEQRDALLKVNEGIERTTHQIDAIQAVIDRAQGLGPSSAQNIAELNRWLSDTRALSSEVQDVVSLKILLLDQAVAQGAVQSQTAYVMGQEMIGTGSALAMESKTASPGRASQITAAAESAQMLSSGVALQTLAQMAQIQAMQLELQKVQYEKESRAQESRQAFFSQELGALRKKTPR